MDSRLPKVLPSDVPFSATKESLIQVLPEDGVKGPALPRSIVEPEPASLPALHRVGLQLDQTQSGSGERQGGSRGRCTGLSFVLRSGLLIIRRSTSDSR